MSDKDKLIHVLTVQGYEAQMINGIPYILNKTVDEAKEIIKSLDYNGSWGCMKSKRCYMSVVGSEIGEESTDG